MEKDLDKKLYTEYLNGNKEAFEYLHNKYKNKIEYFIYNITKDYQKSEDIMQETFIYVMKNEMKENVSFKYYIYLVAKSRAYNYIKSEKRKSEIIDTYLKDQNEYIEKDILELITKQETKKEIIEAINELEEKYRNAIYLTSIEKLSYEETSKILGQSLSNTKNLIHRGKQQLRKILIKKGFGSMNKVSKVIIILLAITITLSGIVYATTKIYKEYNKNHKITMNPTYQSTLNENTINNIWIGTLDIAWKELEEKLGKNKIETENYSSQLVENLNSSTFSKDMLNSNDYEIKIERTVTNGYKIDTSLKKELTFLENFDNFSKDYTRKTFGNGTEYIKYFGINNASSEKMNKNIEILFYNRKDKNSYFNKSEDFAIKLKTKEGDEIILYRTNDNKNFNEYYDDIKQKTNAYTGSREFSKDDELLVPYVRVNGMIAYNELYGKVIENSNGLYFTDIIQNVNFSLNESGCNLSSKATMVTEYLGIGEETKFCQFDDKFIIFMKEKNAEQPYFALKVDNDEILEKIQENDEPKIIDSTVSEDDKYYQKYLDGIEYKFYEDDKFEYYYTSQKTAVVRVYFKNGENMTVEEALKQGKITMNLLDEYGVEYLKKEK